MCTMEQLNNADEFTTEVADNSEVADKVAAGGPTPGDLLRSLPGEAQQRGSQYVSANAMQARLFSIYDAAAAAEDALALVQQQLTLTLDRSFYEAEEIATMAAQLDALLAVDAELSAELTAGLAAEEPVSTED